MTTTYYLLRTKESAVGDGPYLGHNSNGDVAMTGSNQDAHRFDTLADAEQYAAKEHEEFGIFEIEVRNSAA